MSFDKLRAERERLSLMLKNAEDKKLHTCQNTCSNHHDSHKHCNGQNGVNSNSATLSVVCENQRLISSSQPAETVIARRK
ncbi:hypothetical protein LSM04_008420 [Trypanosoma melophagium]|uniref:uncharacterized protein n=1 Tax=Trypanosoma melophagium TaxID=715481 RepID=UPI003519F9A9|nr:hypothetical protein LSM04_008420 [Trypanosoma melophagium]